MSFSEIGIAFLLLMGGSFGFPMGNHPGEEDPRVVNLAPEECLLYVSWSGVGTPDPKGDPSEQWLALPTVKHATERLRTGFIEYADQEADGIESAIEKQRVELLARILGAAVKNSTGMYITDFSVDQSWSHVPNFSGGLAICLGEWQANVDRRFERWVEAIQELPEEEAGSYEVVMVDGRPAVRLIVNQGYFREDQVMFLQIRDDLALLASSVQELERLKRQIATPPPTWLTSFRERLHVDQIASVSFVNIARLFEQADDKRLFDAGLGRQFGLELARVSTIASVAGVDADGFVTRNEFNTHGRREGWLAAFDADPIPDAQLAAIPGDVTFAVVTRLKPKPILELVKKMARDGGQEEAFNAALAQLQEMTGVPLEEELLKRLGNVVSGYVRIRMDQLGSFPWRASIEVEDTMMFPAVFDQITQTVGALIDETWGEGSFTPLEADSEKVYQFKADPQRRSWRPGFLWAYNGEQLLIGQSEQEFLQDLKITDPQKSLLRQPRIQQLLDYGERQQLGRPVAVAYADVGAVLDMAKFFIVGIRDNQEGTFLPRFNFLYSDLPKFEEFREAFEPFGTAMYRTPEGFQLIQRQKLPGAVPFVSAGCVLVFELLLTP